MLFAIVQFLGGENFDGSSVFIFHQEIEAEEGSGIFADDTIALVGFAFAEVIPVEDDAIVNGAPTGKDAVKF